MADTKISAATDITTLATTDMIPVARVGSTTAYRATLAEVKQISAPGFNVKQYGATGNGVTDDTAAIQAAVDAVRTAEGGSLYFPAGTYLTSSTLTINLDRPSSAGSQYSMAIYGDGGSSKIYNNATDGTDCLYVLGVVGQMATLHIHDLSLQGAGSSAATGNGIHLRRCIMPAMIDNVYIWYFGGGAGIKLQSTWLTTIQNVRVFYSLYGISTITDIVPGSYGSPTCNTIRNCDFSGNSIGIYNGSVHQNIENCIVEGNTSYGISLSSVSYASIRGLYFESNGGDDIHLVNCPYSAIRNCQGTTIDIDDNCSGVILEQNSFTNIVSDAYYSRYFYSLPTAGTGGYNILESPSSSGYFGANDATPSVALSIYGYRIYYTANTVPTTITNFDGGITGQEVWVKVHDANTTFKFTPGGTSLIGNAQADYTASNGDMIHAIYLNSSWYCHIIDGVA